MKKNTEYFHYSFFNVQAFTTNYKNLFFYYKL